ncbi:hypothetical protein V8C34DRAFT_293163 [Trichoderma compactum]
MKAQATIALVAGLLANAVTAQTSLGELSFGAPRCGDGNLSITNVADCNTAVAQLLGANCSEGVCSIPAATGGGLESVISVLVGKCEAIIGAFADGDAVTFNEDSVQQAFPDFISQCIATSSGFGSPILTSTDGVIRLVISDGRSGGG